MFGGDTMLNNLEVEYKILVSKQQFLQLKGCYSPLTTRTQTNTYYDTEDYSLRNKKYAMRIRTIGDKFLFTLKTPSKGAHEEHECYVNTNSVEAFKCPEIVTLFKKYDITGDLVKIGECVTHRSIYDNDLAELCFDINEYKNQTDYEIEYEQKVDHDGKLEFNKILSKANLVFVENGPSKIARACSL